jgi:hypothetical protein
MDIRVHIPQKRTPNLIYMSFPYLDSPIALPIPFRLGDGIPLVEFEFLPTKGDRELNLCVAWYDVTAWILARCE